MKRRSLMTMATAVATIVSACALPSAAATPPIDDGLRRVLWGGPRCDHVIRLMMRAAMGEDREFGRGFEASAEELGDLQIGGVAMLPGAPSEAPPTYLVTVTNASPREVCGVDLTLVAIVGQIRPCDPTASERIERIGPGESVRVRVRLPVDALAMPVGYGQTSPFHKLAVAIDSLDQFLEADEANNVLVLNRVDIPMEPTQPPAAEEAQPSNPIDPAPTQEPSKDKDNGSRPSSDPLESAFKAFESESQQSDS